MKSRRKRPWKFLILFFNSAVPMHAIEAALFSKYDLDAMIKPLTDRFEHIFFAIWHVLIVVSPERICDLS